MNRPSALAAVHRILRAAGRLADVLAGHAATALSGVEPVRSGVLLWPETGAPAFGPRVAVMAHWDPRGDVSPAALRYVGALRDAGLDVVLASNAGRLTAAALARLRPLCAAVVVRPNVGYDFAALQAALRLCGLPGPDTRLLLLTNDSLCGPLRPLDAMLARIDFRTADVWGATESWQARYHLQSFFLAAGPAVLHSRAWQEFWTGLGPVRSKHAVIRRCEVGLTQALLRAGLRCQALWPYEALVRMQEEPPAPPDPDAPPPDPMAQRRAAQRRWVHVARANRLALNPTSDLWRQLLMQGFPFLKRELLGRNPTGVRDIADWPDVVRALGGDPAPIQADLRTVLRNRTP